MVKNQKDLSILLLHLESEMDKKAEEVSALFYDQLAEVYELLLKDAKAIDDGDPELVRLKKSLELIQFLCNYNLSNTSSFI